jgi:UDP-N-acetylmuramoylalanine--D-glutamate ligase
MMCPGDVLKQALADLRGSRVTLMGLGLFGGGLGAARFLAASGAHLTVTDLRSAGKLASSLAELRDLPITYHLGGHAVADFTDADLIVAGPGVPRSSEYLHSAARAGIPIASPMNIFLSQCPARIAAVTGSNGKSTTTALLAHMVRQTGRKTWLGGNIGVSLLPSLPNITPGGLVVLELSSFQLQDAQSLCWSPHVAVVTNITPNHLDRHSSMQEYADAKKQIVRHQTPADFAVLNAHDRVTAKWMTQGMGARALVFDAQADGAQMRDGISLAAGRLVWRDGASYEMICRSDHVSLPGPHNVQNAMAAACGARCLGAEAENVRAALASFTGLAHRLELVGDVSGVRYYNDSFSTTPESTVAAVQSFHQPLTLIAGGYDKKLDLTPIACAAAEHAEVFITIGQTGPELAQRARQESAFLERSLMVKEAGSLEEAVWQAARLAMPGMAVVFSPGCASYDMFENCEQRGDIFRQLILDKSGKKRADGRCA